MSPLSVACSPGAGAHDRTSPASERDWDLRSYVGRHRGPATDTPVTHIGSQRFPSGGMRSSTRTAPLPSLRMSQRSGWPSRSDTNVAPQRTGRCSSPFGPITKMRSSPVRPETNAIRRPSGDTSGRHVVAGGSGQPTRRLSVHGHRVDLGVEITARREDQRTSVGEEGGLVDPRRISRRSARTRPRRSRREHAWRSRRRAVSRAFRPA